VSRPAKTPTQSYTHVLIAQDIFSRFIWAKPLTSVTETTSVFEDILLDSEDRPVDVDFYPHVLITDGGTEFNNSAFKSICAKYSIDHVIKQSDDYNAIATLDRAIGILKRIMQRFVNSKGGNWLDHLDASVNAYNNTENSGINAEPSDMTQDVIFSLKKANAKKLTENTKLITKRQDKLRQSQTYRTHEPGKNLVGLKQRIDANTWSTDIHEVKSFPAPGIVEDKFGIQKLTKFAKPVPRDSSTTNTGTDTLESFARTLKTKLGQRNTTLSQAAKEMKDEVGFTRALKVNKLTFKDFVRKYPLFVKINDGRIFST